MFTNITLPKQISQAAYQALVETIAGALAYEGDAIITDALNNANLQPTSRAVMLAAQAAWLCCWPMRSARMLDHATATWMPWLTTRTFSTSPRRQRPSVGNATRPDMKPGNVTWFCMTLDTTNAQARLRFKQLYGCEPAKVIRDHNMVWIGPVPADKAPTPPAAAIAGDDETKRR